MNQISNKARSIKPSSTMAMNTKAKEMIARGVNVINFGVGEPDFNTPDYIKQAAIQAIHDNFTRYTAAAGIPELRKAIAAKLESDNHLKYQPEEILVAPGGKIVISTILTAICDPGDEVIIPVPYWVSYPPQVELADGIPVFLEAGKDTDLKITASQLAKLLNSLKKPKALILNSPNNPTGAVYSQAELTQIAEVCQKYDILILSDEIYEKLIYDGEKHYSIAQVSEDSKNRTIVINGVSKAYAMTGWRLGYAAGPAEIIKATVNILSQTASCVNSIAQKAAVVAIAKEDGSTEKMRQKFEKRRDFIVTEIDQIPHVSCIRPKGAFYTMVDISYYLQNNDKGITNTSDLCLYLLDKAHISIVTGSAFGMENFVRFSYANSMENIKEGLRRFRTGLADLLPKSGK
jgi:aspartate aminotransferase